MRHLILALALTLLATVPAYAETIPLTKCIGSLADYRRPAASAVTEIPEGTVRVDLVNRRLFTPVGDFELTSVDHEKGSINERFTDQKTGRPMVLEGSANLETGVVAVWSMEERHSAADGFAKPLTMLLLLNCTVVQRPL